MWAPDQISCVILNVESNKPTIIVMFVTDAVLLMTMFVGLLRLRRRGGDTFELGRLLWKQVRAVAISAGCGIINLKMLTCSSSLEGVIWLLLGTITELTPVVSSSDGFSQSELRSW